MPYDFTNQDLSADPRFKFFGSTSVSGGPTTQDFSFEGKQYTAVRNAGEGLNPAVQRVLNAGQSEQLNRDPVTGLVGPYNTPVKDWAKEVMPNYGALPINSASVAPGATPAYVSPAPTAAPSVAGLGSMVADYYAKYPNANPANDPATGLPRTSSPTLSAPESELSKAIQDIRAKMTESAGQPAYQAQQEQIQGIQAKEQLVNDLTQKLNLIKVEGQTIPLQSAGVNQTAGMLGAQEAEQQRQNAVKALTVFAQLQGAQGNLATAQAAADRATNLKYAPLNAQIKAGLDSIELFMKDPAYTIAEKERAAQTALRLKDKENQVAESKTITSGIMGILSDPDFQLNAPQSVKTQLSALAQKITLTQADAVLAANLGAKYKTTSKTISIPGDYTNVKEQNALEQQYRTTLLKEVSSRSGGLGLEDQKVNQALHLKALIEQYRDKNGNYNIPSTQYNELTLGLARLVSPTGQVGVELQKELTQRTVKGDINGALTYLTGTPFSGSTQKVFGMLIDSIDRQGQVAEANRNQYISFLQALAPTGLDPARIEKLNKGALNTYTPIHTITNEDATKTLDAIINGTQNLPSGGFWNDFLGIFGLQPK